MFEGCCLGGGIVGWSGKSAAGPCAKMLHKLWLTFHDHELEKRFQSEFNRWGAFTDKGVLIFTVFLRIAILAKLWLARVDQRDFFATLVVSIPVAIEFVGRKYMEKHHPHLLKEWRPTLVASSRWVECAAAAATLLEGIGGGVHFLRLLVACSA